MVERGWHWDGTGHWNTTTTVNQAHLYAVTSYWVQNEIYILTTAAEFAPNNKQHCGVFDKVSISGICNHQWTETEAFKSTYEGESEPLVT